jgi:hypothetical protein
MAKISNIIILEVGHFALPLVAQQDLLAEQLSLKVLVHASNQVVEMASQF